MIKSNKLKEVEFNSAEMLSSEKEQAMKIIGILSGSGPAAGVAIENEMLAYLQDQYGAVDDLDYPDYILYNKPLRGFGVTGIERPDLVEEDFVNAMKKLDNMGAEIIGIACNTLHALLGKVEDQLQAEVVHMIHETCKEVADYENILVLCSATTTRTKLYESYLRQVMGKESILTLEGENQELVDNVIEAAMGGNQGQQEIDIINKIISEYQNIGPVDSVILGCTELPLAYGQEDAEIPVISSNTILAQRLVQKSKIFLVH